jgi:CheY-like chemotaxis protein
VSDGPQLELALLNLAVNARDAMPRGGTLQITARRAEARARHLPRGDFVVISVRDTGTGMTEDVRQRAMEPFFTTKPVGQGTGLGLSQVYGVVRESGGTMTLESQPGEGTSVHITLPSAPRPTSPAARIPPAPTVPAPKSALARVLVVDDDRLVRRFMCDSLRSLGYDITEAANGTAALALLHEGLRVDLLLVDFAMPGMNGAEVARAARNISPDIRVLVVSGYADSAALEAALGTTQQLRKPFDQSELGAAVAAALSVDP